ncbi:exodeoxyribonuclease III [Salsipaludibacter albus]|uniref:exodeoxyribonuclease III n=1 Tax=Salsipaludibacter albus TaxID=2849650 RepID=UPI001EE4AA95|nr:exodeoxyribonuclease III [Salsipaludibacter albus]MBY5161902.1 exodeoxyribonuclease III [Salsipaludibacter albus]
MRVVTWNVNSLRARMPRVDELLAEHAPDVVLLQETKAAPEQFPHLELAAAGYTAVDHSGGRWAGVAVLARSDAPVEAADAVVGLAGSPVQDQARWVEVVLDGIRFISVYVVNGRHPDDPAFAHKLDFLDAMAARLAEVRQLGPVVLGGDVNIAPADVDVWDPAAFAGGTHVSPQERSRLAAMLDLGYVDAVRHLQPEGQAFTWWDYRAGAFHRGRGLRIDLFLVSDDLVGRIASAGIDRDFRKGAKPSDHAPLLLELAEADGRDDSTDP